MQSLALNSPLILWPPDSGLTSFNPMMMFIHATRYRREQALLPMPHLMLMAHERSLTITLCILTKRNMEGPPAGVCID